ncbi:phospholipase A and acyltransferase 3-like [Physella acuta]|uniref:phospholipase A and acyltransferase 3-like n=1 Tax=Physella acuta TaxID=109671 RepID=UPI0027DB54AA|nr:phospholipase A and acyltransferase 3-like [Physella acuta]
MGSNVSVEDHNEAVFRSLKPGDIVKFDRGWYSHYALYIGKGKVIHLTAPDNGHGISSNIRSRHVASVASVPVDKAVVAEGDFFFVAGHDRAYKANKDEWPSFDEKEVLRKAKSMLGETDYHLLTNNCEHFVKNLKYGRKESDQVQTAAGATGVGTFLFIAGAATAIIALTVQSSKNKAQRS